MFFSSSNKFLKKCKKCNHELLAYLTVCPNCNYIQDNAPEDILKIVYEESELEKLKESYIEWSNSKGFLFDNLISLKTVLGVLFFSIVSGIFLLPVGYLIYYLVRGYLKFIGYELDIKEGWIYIFPIFCSLVWWVRQEIKEYYDLKKKAFLYQKIKTTNEESSYSKKLAHQEILNRYISSTLDLYSKKLQQNKLGDNFIIGLDNAIKSVRPVPLGLDEIRNRLITAFIDDVFWKEVEKNKSEYSSYFFFDNAMRLRPFEFEKWCLNLLQWNFGCKVSGTKKTGDCGVDGYMETSLGKKGIIQVKQHKKSIGRPALQQFWGQMLHEEVDFGIFITSGHFTSDATHWCEDKSILLIDREIILSILDKKFDCNSFLRPFG